MKFFAKSKKRGRPKKTPKTLRQIVADAATKAVSRNPELAEKIGLHDAGYDDIIKEETPIEKQQKRIDEIVTKKVLADLENEDSELLDDAKQAKIASILGSSQKRRRGSEPEYYEPGSSISQALDEVESLSALRERLQELGMVEGGGGGFFKGMSMEKLLAALPYIAQIMGKGGAETAARNYIYVVRIDGQDKELNETEYHRLLQQGKIKPLAELKSPEAPQDQLPQPTKDEKVPELPDFLQGIDFLSIETWLDMEPEDFVVKLKSEVDQGVQESMLIWGFLKTATLEGITNTVTPYKDNPKVSGIIEKILSDNGKAWMERVLELVKEK